MSASDGRSSREWRKICDRLKKELPSVCHICGEDIDQSLPPRTRWSWTLDHVDPISNGRFHPHDESNLRPAHQRCNAQKGMGQLAPSATVVTSRRWR